ncbi:MAG: hypothetical protein HQK75_15260 [Candidatus Magnetomorum sp.]|nr:hypothetical protein [Candidatus Magnetomorum sp.]
MNIKSILPMIIIFVISVTVYGETDSQSRYQSKELPSLSILSYNIKQLCAEYKPCNATSVLDLLQLDRFNYELITEEKESGVQFFLSKTMNDNWSIQVNQKRWFVVASDQNLVFELIETAETLANEKDFSAAVEKINQAISLKPDMDKAYFLLAFCKLQQSQFEAFINHAETAISLSPANPEYLNQMAWFYATTKHSKYRDAIKSLQYALKAVSISPDNWFFTDTLAAAYARNGKFHEALDTQNKTIQLIRSSNSLSADRIHQHLKNMNLRKEMYQHRKMFTETN